MQINPYVHDISSTLKKRFLCQVNGEGGQSKDRRTIWSSTREHHEFFFLLICVFEKGQPVTCKYIYIYNDLLKTTKKKRENIKPFRTNHNDMVGLICNRKPMNIITSTYDTQQPLNRKPHKTPPFKSLPPLPLLLSSYHQKKKKVLSLTTLASPIKAQPTSALEICIGQWDRAMSEDKKPVP